MVRFPGTARNNLKTAAVLRLMWRRGRGLPENEAEALLDAFVELRVVAKEILLAEGLLPLGGGGSFIAEGLHPIEGLPPLEGGGR